MAERNAAIGDALAIPLVAYRGLWDKFVRPATLGAVRRSYTRGVPSLVRCAGASEVADVLDLVADPTVNRGRQPAYFVVTELPPAPIVAGTIGPSIAIFAIDASGPSDRTWPIFQQRDAAWVPAGCYVPVAAARRGLTSEDLGTANGKASAVLFESVNVLADTRLSSRLDGLRDDAVYASIRALAGTTAGIARVSDLVELDLLSQRVREAA